MCPKMVPLKNTTNSTQKHTPIQLCHWKNKKGMAFDINVSLMPKLGYP